MLQHTTTSYCQTHTQHTQQRARRSTPCYWHTLSIRYNDDNGVQGCIWWWVEPLPRTFLTTPADIKKTQGGVDFLCTYALARSSTSIAKTSTPPPNEIWQIQPCWCDQFNWQCRMPCQSCKVCQSLVSQHQQLCQWQQETVGQHVSS